MLIPALSFLSVYMFIHIGEPQANRTIIIQESSIPGVGLFMPQWKPFFCPLLFISLKHALEIVGKAAAERWFWSDCSMISSWFTHLYFPNAGEWSLPLIRVLWCFFSRNSNLYLSFLLSKAFQVIFYGTNYKGCVPFSLCAHLIGLPVD